MTTTAPWFVLPDQPDINPPVVVVGAGLAGCHVAYELATRNIKVLLLDAGNRIAGGASGNSVGIVKPFVTRNPGLADQFYAAAFNFLLHRLDTNAALCNKVTFNACGVMQLLERSYPDNPAYRVCDSAQASQIAGSNIDTEALFFSRGGYLNPHALCTALIDHINIDVQLNVSVKQMKYTDSHWLLGLAASDNDSKKSKTLKCGTLILANGEQINQFSQTSDLSITAARGQTSCFKLSSTNNQQLNTIVTGKQYAIPQGNSVVVGATFSREVKNRALRKSDHHKNRTGLKTLLPSLNFNDEAASGFCGIRATTPDRLPIVGPVPDFAAFIHDYKLIKHGLPANRFDNARYQKNLFVIGGLGSRGIVSAPYCAKLLAKHICQARICLDTDAEANRHSLSVWPEVLHPGRFIIRALKRA